MSAKVKWLCKFPDRWDVLPSKRLFPESKERALEGDEQLSATQEYGVISQAEFMRLAGRRVVQLNQNVELRKRVETGDFVISMRSFQGGLERAWAEGGIRSSYVVLRPRADLVPGYYQRLFKSVDYIQALQSTANFIRDGQDMNYQNFVLIDLPFPPVSEQLCIAAFLDHETARIDALIKEQQRLIELLKEKRQAVISHAVTKGLDPTVPMKDSGVDWLGEVPAHWVVSKLKFMTNHVIDCPHETPTYNPDGDYLVIRTADLDQGVLKPDQMYRLERDEYIHRTRRSSLEKNDVVYGREGERWGHAALVPESGLYALGQRMMQFRVSSDICPEYFMYQLNSIAVYRQGEVDTVGATSPHVNISTIINYQMMIPPFDEQARMSLHLNKTLRALDSLIRESGSAMGLLQERRSALISAAVTGKIDAREWHPPAGTQAPVQELEEAV